MTNAQENVDLQAIAEETGRRDYTQISYAEEGLTNLNVPPAVISGFRGIVGRGCSLHLPCGADATARRKLATLWAERLVDGCDFATGLSYGAFEIANPNWEVSAELPCIPLSTMCRETLPRLNRLRHLEIAYAPAVRDYSKSGQETLRPVLRFLIFGLGLNEVDGGFIDSVRRDLGGRRAKAFARLRIRPLTSVNMTAEVFRLLELTPSRPIKDDQPATKASAATKARALIRMMVNATLPFNFVAGGSGVGKQALAGAMGDWRASLKNKPRSNEPIASNEIYPLLGQIPLEVNATRMRLPFWRIK